MTAESLTAESLTAGPVPAPGGGTARRADPAAVLDRAWALTPQVSVRPESFGALLYHFGTRRLSFLKDRRLLAVVEGLAQAPTARAACAAAGVRDDELRAYAAALTTLATTDMIRERA